MCRNLVDSAAVESFAFQNDATILSDPIIWSFNRFYNCDPAVSGTLAVGLSVPINQGAIIDQNVLEWGGTGVGVLLDVDKMANNYTCTNVMTANNTILGPYHLPYDNTATGQTENHYQDLNNITSELDTNCDVNGNTANGTNRWQRVYSVGSSGSWMAQQTVAATYYTPAAGELGFDGLNTYWYTNNPAYIQFVTNNTPTTWGGAGGGRGDYHLKSTSPLQHINPFRRVYPYDVDGNARSNYDPPGAYSSGVFRRGAGFFANQ